MSIFSYAGVGLNLIRTKTFRVEPEFDPSGVDHKWNKFTLSVVGLLAPTPKLGEVPYNDAAVASGAATAAELAVSLGLDAAAAQGAASLAAQAAVAAAKEQRKRPGYDYSVPPPHPAGLPVADTYPPPPADIGEYTGYADRIKHRLMVPRQALYYSCGNLTVRSDGLDCNQGPVPSACEVVTMINGFFLVNITITACLAQCSDNPIPSPVVSLKWTQSEAFNEDWLSTVTTRGKLVVRSDLRQSADSFRHLCVPGLLSDYVRERIEFTLSESGCELGFAVTDKEQAVMPPYGATKADGQFVVVLSGGGAKRVGQVDLSLRGPKGGSRRDLLAIATRMAMSKLGMESLASTVFGGSFREDLFANAVSLSLKADLAPLVGSVDRGAIRSANKTPFVTQGQLPLAPPVRSRLLTLLSAPFYDVCSASPGVDPGRSTTPSTKITNTNPDGTTTTTTRPGTDVPGTQLVPGGSVGMVPSASVASSSVASSTPVGPAAFASARSAPAIDITVVDQVPDPETKDAIDVSDSAPYDLYQCECAFTYDGGVVMLPGTGVGPDGRKALPVTRHGGLMDLVVTWKIERKILSPIMPRYRCPNTNFVPLGGEVKTDELKMSADGRTPVYVVAGWYRYGIIDPDQVSVTAAVPPFLTDTAAQGSKLAAGFFSDRVIWQFQDSGGPNPFTTDVLDQKPGDQVAKSLGAFLSVAGVPTPPAFNQPEAGDFGGGGDFNI